MFCLLQYCAFTTLVLVSSEVLTLIKENNVTCVLTEDSVYSAVYINNYENNTLKRNVQEKENWFENDWNVSSSTELFDLVIDERWMDFGPSSDTSNFTLFSVCLNENGNESTKSRQLREINKDQEHFEKYNQKANSCQWKHFTKIGHKLVDEKHVEHELERFPSNSTVVSKNHKYNYIYSNVSSTKNSSLNVSMSTCLSMYVSIDEECYLNITLESWNGTLKTKLINRTNEKHKSKNWTRIELDIDNLPLKNLIFFRGTYNNDKSGFWAIDEIKDCNLGIVTYNKILESKILPLKTPRCQILDFSPKKLKSTSCREFSYLGQNCNISCSQILGQSYSACEQHRICSENECFCARGYDGETCSKTKCPVVQKAPKLNTIKENFIEIIPNLTNGLNDSTPQYYAVQYKQLNSGENFKYFANFTYSENNPKIIQLNLTTTKSYIVRTILISDEKNCETNVTELIINKKSLCIFEQNNEVYLNWSKPLMQNVSKFEVEYQWNTTFCGNNTGKRTLQSNTTESFFKIGSFPSYEIKLYAKNGNEKFLIDQTTFVPSHLAIIDNDLPKSIDIIGNKTILELEKCARFSGPVEYSIKYKCLNNWCHNREIKEQDYKLHFYVPNITLNTALLPNITRYNISVVAKRLGQAERSKIFTTTIVPLNTEKGEEKSPSHVAAIIGIVIAIMLLFFSIFGLYLWCRKRNNPSKKHALPNYKIKFSELQALQEKDELLDSLLTTKPDTEYITTPLKIENFEAHLLSALEQDLEENIITEEFQKIPQITNASCNEGRMKENAEKNRYTNVLPYDKSRVVLLNNAGGDYINANYVNGYEAPKAFIATQAPKDSTVNDFWLMVFQENVEIIIMLTELKEGKHVKSVQYWPDHLCRYRFGEFIIQSISTKVTPNYVHRELQVKYQNQIRLVHHFQYTTWPDHDVPLSPQDFTKFIKEIMRIPQQNPVVVHCNAGCGRTGTFILCNIAIRMASKENQINLVSILREIREQRGGLVGNAEQYIFAHFVLLEFFFGKDFSVDVSDNFHVDIKKALSNNSLNLLMYRLEQAKKKFESIQLKVHSYLTEEERAKNRFPLILPGHSQIFLPISAQNTSSYINAVCVDCYRYPNKYIVTQQPLPETINDFWKLVMEYEIDTIISLNDISEEDPLCPVFWPQESSRSWTLDDMDAVLSFFSVDDNHHAYDLVRVKLKKKTADRTKVVNIISMKNWKRETIKPPSIANLICVWKKIMACRGKIVVTCYDGATASGFFVALAYMLEKINMEHKCDVFTSVKAVQQSRVQFVEHPEQLKLLYQVAIEYIQEFSTYGNFS